MGIYAKILQDSITGIYRTNAANKILQFINRIRNESDVNQARRFLIELMQNARDLAYKKPDGTPEPVSICIRLSDTELEFSHNGKVFSVKDILSIIYQVSSKKPGEGIGQFGTGFMSTYQLSERVELTSYLKNDDNPYLPFTVCLDRSGLNKEEILDAIERAMAQLMAADQAEGIPDEEFDLTGYNTSFLYHLDQERSREIARIGMEDLDHTILYTLLFSPQIRAVELIYETDFRRERIIYTNGTPVELGNGLYSMEFLQGDRTRHLVYQSAGEGAERITVACEYSDGQILPIGEQTPKLYIDFPLIGAEQFPFPTVINCRALCPNEPRSGISLVDNPNSHDALRNKELMKQAVVLYGQFLHNLVEQDFGSLQNAVAMPVCPENKEWSAQWVRARLYNGCLGCMKREPIFPTRIGKRSLAEGKLCLIRERNEEQRKAVQELAEPFKDLLVPVDDTDWDLALVGYELEKDKWISLERLLQNAEHNAKYRLDTARQDVLSWVGRLYRAAMEAPVLANEIMAGTHPVFLDQEYGRSEQFTLKRFFEVKVDPDIPECLKDASDCVEILCQEEDRLHIRSCLLHPDFPVLPGKQPEDYEIGRLVAYLTGHANVQNTRLLDTKTFSKYRENFWKIMIACGPDENLKRIMEACWKTDLSILAEPVKDSRFSDSIWRGVYYAVLWRLSDWISRCATLDALRGGLGLGEGAVLEWLNVFYRAAVDYLPLYKLKERELVLNQAGIFCRAMNLQEDQVDGELRALAGVLYRKKHETELEQELVDRRVCLPRWEMYVMRDKNAANIINEAVQKLLSEKSLSLAEPQYQDACSRLLGWIGEHENEVKELFPSYCTEEDRMKLLTTRAAVQMNRKVKEFQTLLKDTGVESLEELKKLIQDAETHSSEAKQELFYGEDQDVDFDAEEFDGDLSNEEFSQKLREIGQAGEQYFNQKLIDGFRQQGYDVIREEEHCCQLSAADGRTAEIYRPDSTDYHQAGWDIRVRTTQPEKEEQPAAERVDFYEVKTSTVRSQYRRYLRISNEQMVNAAALGEHYHLVKVICDPASLEAVEHRCYDNLLQYLGNRTLQNVEKGYLWKETRE